MKIQQRPNIFISHKQKENSKQKNNNTAKEYNNNSLDIQSAYNIAFSGLLKKEPQHQDVSRNPETITMTPNQPYKISEDMTFQLGNFYMSLSEPYLQNLLNELQKGQEIIIGRNEISSTAMDSSVSRQHLKLARNKKNELIATDLGSRNGTKIFPNFVAPETYNSFQLQPHIYYLLPENSILELAGSYINLDDIKSYFKKPNQTLILGRNSDADIQTNNNKISKKHLSIEKHPKGYIVKDLGSRNGTRFHAIGKKVQYNHDMKDIYETCQLQPGVPTRIPNNSQLYLGDNFTIDTRNNNILSMLEEKDEITIGKSSGNDITVNNFYSQIDDYHLKLQKDGNDIVATALSGKHNSFVVPHNRIQAFYNGVSNIHLGQANIGDCYLLSTLFAMSHNPKGQRMLYEMVRVDNNGNYIVEFHNQEPISVKPEELDGQKKGKNEKRSVSGDLAIKAIERAYAKMIKNPVRDLSKSNQTLFLDIDDGGVPTTALEKMTGLKSKKYNTRSSDTEKILHQIKQHGMEKFILTCSTYNHGKYKGYMDKNHNFIERHAYAVYDIDTDNRQISIINPHNTKFYYTISWDDFITMFDNIYVAYTN